MSISLESLQANAGYLAEIQCEDGIRLNGFLQLPSAQSTNSIWLIVHGVAGNFYSSSLLGTFANVLQNMGHATLRINTRGHDQIAFAVGSWPSLIGSTYETIAESRFDLRAWILYAKKLGFQRINVIAHSLGAIKSAYFAALQSQQKLVDVEFHQLILVSPPRLNCQSLLEDPRHGSSYERDLQRAQRMIEDGNEKELMQIKFPQPLVISAGTFVDKYGPANRYDYMSWARQVPDAHWIFGELEVRGLRMNFCNCDRMLRDLLAQQDIDPKIHVVSNADHNYTNSRDQLSQLIQSIVDQI